jgi:hypothetical protein
MLQNGDTKHDTKGINCQEAGPRPKPLILQGGFKRKQKKTEDRFSTQSISVIRIGRQCQPGGEPAGGVKPGAVIINNQSAPVVPKKWKGEYIIYLISRVPHLNLSLRPPNPLIFRRGINIDEGDRGCISPVTAR